MARYSPSPESIEYRSDNMERALRRDPNMPRLSRNQIRNYAINSRYDLSRDIQNDSNEKRYTVDPNDKRFKSLEKQIKKVRSQSVKKEGFIKKTVMFPIRHPGLTVLGLGAAAFFGAPYFAKLWAGAERGLASVPMNRMIQTIRSAGPLGPRMRPAPRMEFDPAAGA